MTAVASQVVPQSVPTSQESDPQLTDQALEERIEQILQELVCQLEKELDSVGLCWEPSSVNHHLIVLKIPPELDFFSSRTRSAFGL